MVWRIADLKIALGPKVNSPGFLQKTTRRDRQQRDGRIVGIAVAIGVDGLSELSVTEVPSGSLRLTVTVLVTANVTAPRVMLVFSGRRWVIQEIDDQDRVIMVVPSKGGTSPVFGGDPDRLIERMFKVLETKTSNSMLTRLSAI